MFILLSTFNGAAYLAEQLHSLLTQTHTDWVLYWRDDGSDDSTIAVLLTFTARVGAARCVRIVEPQRRLWPTESYLALVRAVLPDLRPDDCIAFADQDDVWLPNKLARGVAALRAAKSRPTLYCARLSVVTAGLRRISETSIACRRETLTEALTQNIAIGCTVMLNRRATMLLADSRPPPGSFHDWWSYLLVAAAGGRVQVDYEVVALYRQHAMNFVGIKSSRTRRAIAALRRGRGPFMDLFRQHVAAFVARPDLIGEANHAMLVQLHQALHGSGLQRLRALWLPGLRRRDWLETLLFRIWFLIG